jgi:hypothetical protein
MIRKDRRGFSALYGAFGVLLVATALIGGVLSTLGPREPSPEADRELAGHFLDTVLASHVENGTTLRQALAESCFRVHCSAALWEVSQLRERIGALATPLAQALGRSYTFAVTAENITQLRVGPAGLSEGGATATVEVFRPRVGDFVGVSLLLSPAS